MARRQDTATTPRGARGRGIRVSELFSARTVLLVSVALLTAIGIVMVFSATSVSVAESNLSVSAEQQVSPYNELRSQILYVGIGVLFAWILVRASYRIWLSKLIYVLFAIILILLVLVLAGGGSDQGFGATRWLAVGGFTVQPSEFAKIMVVLMCARLFAAYYDGAMTLRHLLIWLAVFVGSLLLLILAQKDLGTLIIIGASAVCMLLLAGCPALPLFITVLVMVAAMAILIVTAAYRSSRFTVWLTDPWQSTDWYYDQGWQSAHGLLAFGSGGFFGVGLGNSRQKYSYLPMSGSDFVFAIIGEELGLLGTLFVVALFCAFGWAGFRIARDATDTHGKLLAGGLTACILVQALINMCGVLRLLPLTGRPLPFISSGGSAMLSAYMMVGLIVSVANVTRIDNANASSVARRKSLQVIEGGAVAPAQVRASGRPERAQGDVSARRRASRAERAQGASTNREAAPSSERPSARAQRRSQTGREAAQERSPRGRE